MLSVTSGKLRSYHCVVVKNQSNDPRMNCMWHNDMKDFLIVETSLIEDNYDFIEKAIFFEQLELYHD